MAERHFLHVEVAHQRYQTFQARRERRGLSIEIDEEKSLPHLRRDLGQPAARLIEVFAPFDERRAQEPAPQVVGPCVIGALEMLRVAAPARDRHPAVPADVGEHPQPAVPVAYDQQRLPEQIDGPVVARRRRLLDPPDAEPLPAEHFVDFEREELRRGVEAGRHAPCLPVGPVEAGAKGLVHAFR